MRTQVTVGTVLIAAVALLTACTGAPADSAPDDAPAGAVDLAAIEEAAKEEGEVVWYTSSVSANEVVAEAFEKEYGIKVDWQRFSSADMAQRTQADARATGSIQADVVSSSDAALLGYLQEEGLIRSLTADDFPDYPAEYMLGDIGPVIHFSVPVIPYNTAGLDGWAPKSWDDLLDPRLEGKLMINDPQNSAAWATVWYTLLNSPDYGEEYLQALAAESFQPVASSLVGVEQLVAGQGAALIAALPGQVEPLIEEGQPLDYFFPENPAPVSRSAISITEDAPHPNAAYLFTKWLTREAGSALYNSTERTASPLGDLEGTVTLPSGIGEAPDPDELTAAVPRIAELLGFN